MSSIRKKRIINDLKNLMKEDFNNMVHIDLNEENIEEFKFMIIGPKNTPYYNGFYIFKLTFSDKYPFTPPEVIFLSTNGKIRFHPNMYENGKVCLSILNTWTGPKWTSLQNPISIIINIQSLFVEHPYLLEPGHENDDINISNKFNKIINYENINFSVINQINNIQNDYFKQIMHNHLKNNYQYFIDLCNKHKIDDKKLVISPKPFNYMKLNCSYSCF